MDFAKGCSRIAIFVIGFWIIVAVVVVLLIN
jgi:hypothetical protein